MAGYEIRTVDGELYHYGILGMKWGVRRYQNADGSLTASGRKRYLSDDGKSLNKKGLKEARKLDRKITNKFKKSDKKEFTRVDNEYTNKYTELAKKTIEDVKSKDPNIGAVVIMSDGKAYTSRNYQEALDNGLSIKKVNWVCYGSTLADTMDMLATTAEYGRDKEFKDLFDKYKYLKVDAMMKDAGVYEAEKGNELLQKYLNR